ncbi:MAG: methyltransferase domain-containing protein [Bosea sp. (in: a-proteobacteria)]|uniref:class I SAM-dependent methyltransferase n=1 Tax=Bosea sp. (in: a-proteobacteria) TaxID=1871050 RepID=UPI0027347574|nr:class I SAM-dependent methyltransferase [Bosea sp. (in: a-proteobacteria)]MDP3255064.1 methyltransferase domain-containing protein [Bosea sp. (in: a-proteobacteria)]MDP3319151.1 methyltransferase domain-containing protein [Bosea sp. (in: a-proteobacteria)]
MSWRDFWNGEHAIYVSPRHKTLHYRQIATDLIGHIPVPDAVVLDHGCGEALDAARVAGQCGRLYLCEAAPSVRDKLRAMLGGKANVTVVAPEEVEALPDATLDLVVANSLIQYLSRDELVALLGTWHAKLKPGGKLVVADIIPPDISPLTDASQLLAFAWRGGFLIAALAGLVRTAFSDYRKLRAQYGLSTYRIDDIAGLIAAAGFAEVSPAKNFGHNPHRLTLVARKAG